MTRTTKFAVLAVPLALAALLPAARAQTSPKLASAGTLQQFAAIGGKTPIGIVVTKDSRVFMSFPRAMDPGAYSVAEIVNGKPVPYPNAPINRYGGGAQGGKLVSVQGITLDNKGRLWLLDCGVIGTKPTEYGGPKLAAVDLKSNKITKTIVFPRSIAGPNAYLNDVRVSLETGKGGTAFITDSSEKGPNGIVVMDLATGKAMRRLNNAPSVKAEPGFVGMAEGYTIVKRPPHGPVQKDETGADGLAIRGDGKMLYYGPNEGLHIYAVPIQALTDPSQSDAQVKQAVQDLGAKPGPSDGIACDASGHVYTTDWEHNAVYQYTPGGAYKTVAQSLALIWPDSLAIGPDGYLYVTATQLNRQAKYHRGHDIRQKPIKVYRVQLNAKPVMR